MKGVILAAGQGSRMSSVTYDAYPKELLPIGGVPTIRFVLEVLKVAGLTKIFVVIDGKTKNGIVTGLGSGNRFGVDIGYVVQERRSDFTGLGAAIHAVKGWIDDGEDVVAACGDTILCDFSKSSPYNCVEPMLKVHKFMDAAATVLVYPTTLDPSRYGVVKFNKIMHYNDTPFGRLDYLVEKPNSSAKKTLCNNGYYYIITGYYAFKPRIFSYIEKTKPGINGEVQITDAIELALENGERVCAVVHARNGKDGVVPCHYWDMGNPEDYIKANKYLFDMNPENSLR